MDPKPFMRGTQALFAMMDGVPFGLCLVDKSGTIRLLNDTFEEMFGRSRAGLINASIETVLPKLFREGRQKKLEGYFAAPRLTTLGTETPLYACHGDGTEFPVEVTVNPINTELGTMVVATVMDTSMRGQMEASFHAAVAATPTPTLIVGEGGRILGPWVTGEISPPRIGRATSSPWKSVSTRFTGKATGW